MDSTCPMSNVYLVLLVKLVVMDYNALHVPLINS